MQPHPHTCQCQQVKPLPLFVGSNLFEQSPRNDQPSANKFAPTTETEIKDTDP